MDEPWGDDPACYPLEGLRLPRTFGEWQLRVNRFGREQETSDPFVPDVVASKSLGAFETFQR
jgi:hypothetical protein